MLIRSYLLALATAPLVFLNACSHGEEPADSPNKAYILNVGRGQLFSDTGLDVKTKPVLAENPKEPGKKAIKVALFADDSVGSRLTKLKNWKPYSRLCFDVFNTMPDTVSMTLNIFHVNTKDYKTRTVYPLKLNPGKNEFRIDLTDLTNVNGSAPAFQEIVKFFFHDTGGVGPTLYFGDIWLESDGAAAAAPATNPSPGSTAAPTSPSAPATAPAPAAVVPTPIVGYKIKGKVGNTEIDLIVTPFTVESLTKPASTSPAPATPAATAPAAPPSTTAKPAPALAVAVHDDPARTKRIHAAKMPKIDQPVLFNTAEADGICSALEIFPANNPWNLVIEDWPLHPQSPAIIAAIGADKPFRGNQDMGFVLAPPNQKKVEVKLVAYQAESDPGPYPAPDNTPIEGWPLSYKGQKLDDVQRKDEGDIDRHGIVVDPTNRMLYEFYQLRKTDSGWQAAGAAIFDFKSNKMRPDGWTSTDAAGLPIFPAVVRHDEIVRGAIEHALRVTVRKTRRAYVYPATHFASKLTDENLPRMGERIRLKKEVDLSKFSSPVQIILKAAKKYGMFVADNGIEWAISIAPDERINISHEELRKIKGSDFEVVEAPAGYEPPE